MLISRKLVFPIAVLRSPPDLFLSSPGKGLNCHDLSYELSERNERVSQTSYCQLLRRFFHFEWDRGFYNQEAWKRRFLPIPKTKS